MESKKSNYKTRLRPKGQLTLPPEVRELLKVSEGSDVEFYRNELGQVVIQGVQTIAPEQAWFWSDRWQRIMAHLSQDPALMQAFQEGKDIHRETAALVFKVTPEEVTDDMRRRAKEVNFGIMYGMGPYGLASRLEIPQEEAEMFIFNYFASYPRIQEFMMNAQEFAHKNGYVTTLLNRRRYLPDIHSDNRRVREFAERNAINTPIQGTAADLIKVAMIKIFNRIKAEKLQSKMIMQVHDELVFETPKSEIEAMKDLVRSEMENAIELSVSIKVDIGIGNNWLEAH